MVARFIFMTGGVLSSLGKGVAMSSIGSIIQSMGYTIKMKKMDPYLNVDPGTLNPYEHGEVFVTEDGAETDLDLGHYERFTGIRTTRDSNITTGRVYESIIHKERAGDYLGKTVQVVPHVINEIKEFIVKGSDAADFVLCEIGGTVGDIEVLPFLEALRQIKNEYGPERVASVHLTLVPYIKGSDELKTKPTQNSVKEMLSVGIQPDFVICRCERSIPEEQRHKIALFCNMKPSRIIEAIDTDLIYEIPILFNRQGLGKEISDYFKLDKCESKLSSLSGFVAKYRSVQSTRHVSVGVVGKYVALKDAYKSIHEALVHAGVQNNVVCDVKWINSEHVTEADLEGLNGILVPGGFGSRAVDGKLMAIKHARENKIPFFGICFGMQLAIIEFARNVLGITDADSTEINPNTTNPIISKIDEWKDADGRVMVMQQDLGGTMRLGNYECFLKPGSLAYITYDGAESVSERHRHRYEVNIEYKPRLEEAGLVFSGMSKDNLLSEIIELPDHPWFMATQFHPEFSSTPVKVNPIFKSYLKIISDLSV